ncbi:MAG: Bcr/CflA family drug resistance efflux transporter, partial [Casimicrobiaceae bacterium]
LFAFLAGSAFVFESVMGAGARGFGFLFGAVMLGNITGATIASRVVRRFGIDRVIRFAAGLGLAAGAVMAALAWADVVHPLAIVLPMFVYMVSLMLTAPQAMAGAMTPFPRIAGAAASLQQFGQFVFASTAALIVGLTYDHTSRPMATTIAVSALLAFVCSRWLIRRTPPSP